MISPLLKINKHEMQCGFLVQGFLVRALSKFQKTWQKLLMVPATDHHIQLLLLIDFG